MSQRVIIDMRVSCNPSLHIADEPTTALDVTIQDQIVKLIKQIQQDTNMGVLFITHDLGVVSELCDRVIVMYAGRIVEEATVKEIFNNPKHTYTKGLIDSVPKISANQGKLYTIPVNVTNPRSE